MNALQRTNMKRQLNRTSLSNRKAGVASLLTALLLSGCAVGPDYRAPHADVPAQWSGGKSAPEA